MRLLSIETVLNLLKQSERAPREKEKTLSPNNSRPNVPHDSA